MDTPGGCLFWLRRLLGIHPYTPGPKRRTPIRLPVGYGARSVKNGHVGGIDARDLSLVERIRELIRQQKWIRQRLEDDQRRKGRGYG